MARVVSSLPNNKTDDQQGASINAGTFQNPSSAVRPRFRYWVPDASVDLTAVGEDIAGAASAGAGGVEVLGYYLYGGSQPGDYAPVDWSKYGWGTPAWSKSISSISWIGSQVRPENYTNRFYVEKLLDTIINVHIANDMVMDFAMGPNQGQGVPAEVADEGLVWDLTMSAASVPVGGSFNDVIPGWGSGELQSVVTAVVTNNAQLAAYDPGTGLLGSPGPIPDAVTVKTLAIDTVKEVTAQVKSDGTLSADFSSDSSGQEHLVFATYLYQPHFRAQQMAPGLGGPQTWPTDMVSNGSFIVDHFSSRGAKVMTDFWEKYLLIDGTKENLQKVGNYGWEDSIEVYPNLYWTKDLPEAFNKTWGYSISKYLPIIMHQNALWNNEGTWYITDEPDNGNSYVADYRTTV